MKNYITHLPRLFLFALGLLSCCFPARAQTGVIDNVNVERYTDLGGGQVRWDRGTLARTGVFSRIAGGDFGLTLLQLNTTTLTAVNGRYLMLKSLYTSFSAGDSTFTLGYPRSTEIYSVQGGDYYIVTAASTPGGGDGGSGGGTPTPAATIKPVNVSTLTLCPAGGSVTAGFVLEGTGSQQVLIRAIGPGLTPLGVGGVLANPKLTVNKASTILKTNDDWSTVSADATALSAAFTAAGAFGIATGSKDAAVLLNLDAGAYTAQAASVDAAASGLVILEVYILKN